jgi:predicted GNAT family acetyltransferase
MTPTRPQPRTHRITAEQDGYTSLLSGTIETLSDNRQWFTIEHVEVPHALRGKGIAGSLVEQAFAYAQAHDLSIALVCPFAVHYASRHPALQARVSRPPSS